MGAVPTVEDFASDRAEVGVGLALRDGDGRYAFFVAGRRFRSPAGERFYAGVGGHREPGESLVACAHREAREEIGVGVELEPAPATWYLPEGAPPTRLPAVGEPAPLALYEMRHLPGSPRAGELYRLVIFAARLGPGPLRLAADEVAGVLSLTRDQVVAGAGRRVTIATLVDEGARFVPGEDGLPPDTVVYPIGTALALSTVLAVAERPGR